MEVWDILAERYDCMFTAGSGPMVRGTSFFAKIMAHSFWYYDLTRVPITIQKHAYKWLWLFICMYEVMKLCLWGMYITIIL